ncbi:hypothetical protein KM043_000764 [Ampulex compressa]|nr:hypothetical protein KM043_000764 [Ampulex compressa]
MEIGGIVNGKTFVAHIVAADESIYQKPWSTIENAPEGTFSAGVGSRFKSFALHRGFPIIVRAKFNSENNEVGENWCRWKVVGGGRAEAGKKKRGTFGGEKRVSAAGMARAQEGEKARMPAVPGVGVTTRVELQGARRFLSPKHFRPAYLAPLLLLVQSELSPRPEPGNRLASIVIGGGLERASTDGREALSGKDRGELRKPGRSGAPLELAPMAVFMVHISRYRNYGGLWRIKGETEAREARSTLDLAYKWPGVAKRLSYLHLRPWNVEGQAHLRTYVARRMGVTFVTPTQELHKDARPLLRRTPIRIGLQLEHAGSTLPTTSVPPPPPPAHPHLAPAPGLTAFLLPRDNLVTGDTYSLNP